MVSSQIPLILGEKIPRVKKSAYVTKYAYVIK